MLTSITSYFKSKPLTPPRPFPISNIVWHKLTWRKIHTHNHSSQNIPALAKRRVGSLKGTTGLDFQLTWFLPSKKPMKVSLTRFAGHSTCWVSAPGMAATGDDGEWRDLAARKGSDSGSSGGGTGLQFRKEMSKALTPNPLFIHSSISVLVFLTLTFGTDE